MERTDVGTKRSPFLGSSTDGYNQEDKHIPSWTYHGFCDETSQPSTRKRLEATTGNLPRSRSESVTPRRSHCAGGGRTRALTSATKPRTKEIQQ
jgi:hypothetical protein